MDELLFKIAEAQQLAHDLLLPPSREKSMVITKLDEARLWAKDIKLPLSYDIS